MDISTFTHIDWPLASVALAAGCMDCEFLPDRVHHTCLAYLVARISLSFDFITTFYDNVHGGLGASEKACLEHRSREDIHVGEHRFSLENPWS